MSYTYPLTPPPSPVARTVTIMPEDATSYDESPFDYSGQSYDFGGERLRLAVELPPMRESEAADWAAFFLKLKGRYGTFTFVNPFKRALLGSASGTIRVNGAGQTGTTLNVDGLSNNLAIAFNNYDHFTLESRLKVCVANSSSNGSGQAVLTIWPALDTAPADNAILTIADATGVYRLAEPASFNIEVAKIYGFSFTAIEAL